jgi:pSer/pThr/pTyr-binding forkhead associated (FHA) protein
VTSTDLERLARTAYEAHRGAHPGSLPPWEDTTEQEQQAWRAAVSAVTGQGDVTLAEGVRTQSLVVQAGDQTRIFQADFTAGRQGTLAISDEHASSHHALFQFAHGLWYVEDLGSTNGTWLNGRRIFKAQRLKKGDKIRIGRTVMIVVSA